MDKEEKKENDFDVNFIKKYLCPIASCEHEKKKCTLHDIKYCPYFYCYGCLSDLKKPQLKRSTNYEEVKIQI